MVSSIWRATGEKGKTRTINLELIVFLQKVTHTPL